MRKILITINFVLFTTLSFATNYYIDTTNGNDKNSGKAPEQAWQSIEKVNGVNLVPGDSVLLKRGEIFRGNLRPRGGSDVGNITYGAYGKGSKPKLFGSVQKNSLSDWVNAGENIWQTFQPSVHTVGAELLPNPDFNSDLSDWHEYHYTTNGASSVLSRTTATGEYYTSPGGGKLVCTNQGTARSDIQLWTLNCPIDSAKWYKFVFKAKASQQFTIPSGNITLFSDGPPYGASPSQSKAALITTSWATYEMYYKSPVKTNLGRITFYFGNIIPNGTTFYFDSLSFKELDGDPGLISLDVGDVIFNNDSCGIKVRKETDLNAQGKFWHDMYNANLKMYSVSNPALYYSNIELALDKNIIDISGKSYITYENLDLRYGAAHAIGGSNTHHIWIKDLDFSWIGGGFQPGLVNVRYGNGVEFWCAAHDNIVERCTFNQIYDAALTVQGKGSVYEAYNIYFRNNIVRNSEYSYEFWGDPAGTYLYDIYFENNTCLYAGFGWSHTQRPDPNGTHLMFWGYVNEKTKNIFIRNNIFYESSNYGSRFDGSTANKVIVDYNCWYESSGAVAQIDGTNYDFATQWETYQKASGHDAHSIHANPHLNPVNTLMNNSPCIDSGTASIAVTEDMNQAPRPQGENYDIGAFEYNFPCTGTVPGRPEAIAGNLIVCSGSSNTYNTATIQGAYFTWQLPEGWTGTSITNSITANAGTTGGNITVTANNGCGSSVTQTITVITNPIPATPVITVSNGILQSNATNGNQWCLGSNIIPNATYDTYAPSLKGNYYVLVTLNGCSSKQSNIISYNPTEIDEINSGGYELSVYPNPTTGVVKIILTKNFSTDYTIDIYDNNGWLLQTINKNRSESEFNLDFGKFPTGLYLLRIYNLNKYYQTKVVKR